MPMAADKCSGMSDLTTTATKMKQDPATNVVKKYLLFVRFRRFFKTKLARERVSVIAVEGSRFPYESCVGLRSRLIFVHCAPASQYACEKETASRAKRQEVATNTITKGRQEALSVAPSQNLQEQWGKYSGYWYAGRTLAHDFYLPWLWACGPCHIFPKSIYTC
jgi:hypothetical protein